jgi:ABC-type polysaccharide/polyol phosphate transport system ATPase subunit
MDAIVVDGVTKTYRVGVGRARVREMLPWPLDRVTASLFPRWWQRDTFDALAEVSFRVPPASSVGIVGHNGAGKTTLLKTIAGVTHPTSGAIQTSGPAAALIDVLVGFHPDLTGRENAYLLGAVYGVGRKAMTSRIDAILEFAEIDELADTPVKRFSSGMAARLGFATMTALDVEILLIDEVLAVGDAYFQRKCVRWLDGFRSNGGTLLFVSHNLGLVRGMTERAIHLRHGRVVDQGPTPDVLGRYASTMERRDEDSAPMGHTSGARKAMRAGGLHRWGTGGARVEEVHIQGPFATSGVEATIRYTTDDLHNAAFHLGFIDETERELGGVISELLPLKTDGIVECTVDALPLRPGLYFPVVAIVTEDGQVRDRWRLDRAIVIDGDASGPEHLLGPIAMSGTWSLRQRDGYSAGAGR